MGAVIAGHVCSLFIEMKTVNGNARRLKLKKKMKDIVKCNETRVGSYWDSVEMRFGTRLIPSTVLHACLVDSLAHAFAKIHIDLVCSRLYTPAYAFQVSEAYYHPTS